MFKKVFGVVLIITAMIFLFSSCCDDAEKLNPVSENPTDGASCGLLKVDTTGTTGDSIGIFYEGEYSKVTVLWGDNTQLETYPKVQTNEPIAYHSYASKGTYHLTSTIYDKRGYPCDCSKWIVISDNNNPVGTSFNITGTPSYGKPTLNVVFTYAFSATDGATCSAIAWDFGDGTTAEGLGTSHSYTATGTYQVKATETDSLGRTAKAYATITVSDNPTPPPPDNIPATVSITSDKVQVDVKGTINFTATASDPDGTVTNYDWVLGGGASDSGPAKTNVAHEYFETSGATYSVYCIVTDNDGATTQSNSISITIKPNLAPTVKSEINGYPEGSTPEVTVGDTVTIDMCSSTDPNSGDSISGSRYSSTGLNPSSKDGAACIWNATATTSGTISIVLHVTDSYSLESNAKSRQLIVRTAEPQCVVTNATAQKIVIQYSLTGGTCSPYPSTSTYNNPGSGTTFGRGCPVTSGSKNFLTEGTGTYSVTWTMRVNATNCDADDRVTVTTQLQNVCGGSDVNNDIYIPNVVPNVYNTYSITLGGNCTNTNRRWNFLVDGVQLYYSILDSVNAH